MKNRQHKPIMIKDIFKSLLVLWLMIITFTLTAEQQKKTYRVLILNSSTSHVATSNKIIDGIIDTLKQKSLTIDCYTEMLDSKSFKQTPELELLILKYLNVKYPGKFFDFIVVTDDVSYQFLLKYREKIQHNTPVIFCGVNKFSRNQLLGVKHITGIIQRTDSLPLLQLALRQNQQAEVLWVICDNTLEGQYIVQSIAQALHEVRTTHPKLKVNYLLGQNISTRNLLKKMQTCSPNGIALVGSWTKDFQEAYNPKNSRVYQQLCQTAQVPLYGFGKQLNIEHFVSIRLDSNYNIGREAAYIILELISGTPIAQIQIDSRDDRQFVFNWHQLQRWHLALDQPPSNFSIVNKPHSFYDRYKPYILLGSGALLIQVLVIILLFSNIYHRRQLRAELTVSEQRLRKALDIVPHAIIAVDCDDNILLANEAAAKAFNVNIATMNSSNLRELYGPPGLAKLLCDNHGTSEQSEPSLIPNMIIRDEPTGMLYEYSLSRSSFPLCQGRAAVLLCVIDNTALRETEQARRQNEELYRNIFENSEGGILFANLENMQAVHANPAFCKMLGYQHDEISNLEIKDFHPLELHGVITNAMTQLHNNLAQTKHFSALPVLKKDGMLVFADITAGTIMLNGAKCVVMFFVDVTERQKIENELIQWKDRLELALNSSRLGMWDWFLNTNTTQVNDTMLDILGVTREEFSNEYGFIKNFIHHEDLPMVKQALSNHLKGKSELYEAEFRINRNYRKWIWLHLVGKVVKNDRLGKPERLIGFVQDITERKNFEDELRRAKEGAEESDRLKSSFLANMSHEIRTPLNAISGFANLVNDKSLSQQKLEEYTQLICKSSDQLLKIISDILDLSKIENRQLKLNNAPLNLDETLRNIYHIFAARTAHEHENQVELRLSIPPAPLETEIFADESRIIQIFTNLLGNALKFTAAGYIEFGYQLSPPEIIFYVKDTGTGIPEEKHDLVFEEFAQADNTITKQYGGTGLGLSICRQLVNLMGGRIWLTSKPGTGSTFFFALPKNKPTKLCSK
jgi:PAS domain S-box-containing protein